MAAWPLAPLIAACGSDAAEAAELRSNVARGTPDAAATELAPRLAAAIEALGRDALQSLSASQDGNLFLSPYSISVAVAMVRAGAHGTTGEELITALRLSSLSVRADAAFNAVDAGLRASASSEVANGQPFELWSANGIWTQSGFHVEQEFLDTLARFYGAGVHMVDFERSPEPARAAINGWVEDQTKKRIKDLIPARSIDSSTRLVLANAIYFKADWAETFDPKETAAAPFTPLDGSTKDVQMMRSSGMFAYAAEDGVEALELPYLGGDVSMVLIVPEKGRYEAVEPFAGRQFDSLVAQFRPTAATLSVPKWQFTSEFALKEMLQAMGAQAAFDSATADLSGIDGERDLYVAGVYHKAFVSVDEKGTEAAAATGASVNATSAPSEAPLVLKIDRPFLFAIRHRPTGVILLTAGCWTRPSDLKGCPRSSGAETGHTTFQVHGDQASFPASFGPSCRRPALSDRCHSRGIR